VGANSHLKAPGGRRCFHQAREEKRHFLRFCALCADAPAAGHAPRAQWLHRGRVRDRDHRGSASAQWPHRGGERWHSANVFRAELDLASGYDTLSVTVNAYQTYLIGSRGGPSLPGVAALPVDVSLIFF
jgi:hypothetical protein